jgi:hypothetical protein
MSGKSLQRMPFLPQIARADCDCCFVKRDCKAKSRQRDYKLAALCTTRASDRARHCDSARRGLELPPAGLAPRHRLPYAPGTRPGNPHQHARPPSGLRERRPRAPASRAEPVGVVIDDWLKSFGLLTACDSGWRSQAACAASIRDIESVATTFRLGSIPAV